jgi:hypothetical protein
MDAAAPRVDSGPFSPIDLLKKHVAKQARFSRECFSQRQPLLASDYLSGSSKLRRAPNPFGEQVLDGFPSGFILL